MDTTPEVELRVGSIIRIKNNQNDMRITIAKVAGPYPQVFIGHFDGGVSISSQWNPERYELVRQ
jgi:hypothetical protein